MPEPSPSESIAKLLAKCFIERRDTKAVQMRDNKGCDMYAPHRLWDKETRAWGPDIPVRLRDLIDHVDCRMTIGHYLVSTEGTCRIAAFDIDLVKTPIPFTLNTGDEPGTIEDPRAAWMSGAKTPETRHLGWQMRAMSQILAERSSELIEMPVTVHYSGSKGVHVTILLEPKTPADDARDIMHVVLESLGWENYQGANFWRTPDFPALHIETYPKQGSVSEGGYGNLLRLPLGMNVKSGKKSFFIDMNQPTSKWIVDDPILALTKGSLR